MDRKARIITILALLIIAGGVAFLFYESGGTYLPAWFTTLVAALILLAALSVPRFILVSPHSVEIHCTVQLVKISIKDIKSIRFLERSDMRFCFPLWGIFGIFGYYGYYFNLKQRQLIRLHASRWKNFILIEDVYEDTFVVNCEDPQDFIAQIEKYR